MIFSKKQTTQTIKSNARRSLKSKLIKTKENYVIDTSAIINKLVSKLIRKGLTGKVIVPNAVMAELENMANKGREEGFLGLEEVASFHKLKNNFPVKIFFEGIRPNESHIRHAKSGEIDAIIRDIAYKNKATLITADLVQAKSAQAYNLEVFFLKPKIVPKKKRRFLFWKK